MQQLEGLIRRAMAQYEMVQPGDHICVGVSGGKDSVALAVALGRLRRYSNVPFTLTALTLDPCFGGRQTDYGPLAALLEKEGIPHHLRRTDIGHVVFTVRREDNPCSLCAKMRRGILHDEAKALGCNKIALGHHLDDAVETFYMNLWGEGRLGCFSPKSYLSRKDLTMIRPMVLATEAQVVAAAKELALPITPSGCPIDGATRREEMKQYVLRHSAQDPAFRQKTLGAMQKAHLSGW